MSLDKNKWINESTENAKTNWVDTKTKFINEFSKSFLAWKDKTRFINEVIKSNSIDESTLIKRKIDAFKAYSDDLDIRNFDASKINIFDLKRSIWKDYAKLNNTRLALKEKVLNDYALSEEWYKLIFDSEISNKNIEELEIYLNSDSKLEKFLNSISKFKTTKRTSLFPVEIWNLSEDEKKKRFDNLSPLDKKNEVIAILLDISNGRLVDSDIRTLFETNLFNDKEKIILINTFIPYITLKQAVDFWLISNSQAEKKKSDILKEVLKKDIKNLNLINEIILYTSLSDLRLKTSDFKLSSENISSLVKNVWFSNFERDYNNAKKKFSSNESSNESSSTLEDLDENLTNDWVSEKIKENNNNWINTINSVINELTKINSSTWQFENINKLEEWNIMKLTKKSETAEDIIQYVLIKKTDDENKQLTFLKVGSQSDINLSLDWEWNTISYSEFVNNFKKSKTKLNFFTKKEIEEQIEDPTNDELNNSDLKLFTHDDLKDFEVRKKYKDHYLDKLKLEIDDLKEELRKKWWKPEDNPLLVAQIEEKENYLKWVDVNYDLDNDKLLKFLNFRKFVEKLDKIDSKWAKFWFQKWVFFESGWTSYEITWVDENNQISLNSVAGREWPIDLETFYQVFKKNKASRVETIKDFDSIIDARKGDDKKWDKHEIVNWKIIAKWVEDWDEKGDRNVDYLVSTKNNEVVKINSIVWNTVFVQFWDRKDLWDLSEDEKKKDKIWKDAKWEKIYLDSTEHQISLNELNNYIDEFSLHPDWKVWKTLKQSEPKDLQNKYNSKFSTRLFNKTSINEIIAWWTMFIEWFKESIKRWNDVHAAKVALAMWSILPEEIRADLQIKVETAEWAEMDKALEWLGKVDSWIATERIKWWLLNKDTPEYKKEAWIMFMLDKYWHLCAKWALYEFRWKWLWYEALWGKINDELFLAKKAEAEASNITFDEEFLVHMLLKKQCWRHWNPKRRSRLHKEYEWKWKSWVNAEFDKWYWDAEKKRTATDMVKWWNDEALWGTTSNAIGWYKKAIERWGSLEEMSEWFFALLYSGSLYWVNQATFLKIKDLFGWWMPIIMTRFSSLKSDMSLFNETVLELSKRIWQEYSKEFPKIEEEAQALFNDTLNNKWDEKKRFERALDFWKKYGTPLSRSLNIANKWDEKYSKTDKLIFLERNSNKVFWNYFKKVRWFTTEWTFKKDFMDDACWQVWLTWLNVNELTKMYLWVSQNQNFKDPKTWNTVWNEIFTDLKNINKKTFYNDEVKDRLAKREYLLHIFNDLLWWIMSNVGWNLIWTYNNNQMNMWKYFNSIWLNLKNDFINYSVSDFDDWQDENWNIKKTESNVKLLKIIDNILDWKTDDISKIDNESIDDKIINEDPFDEIISESKKSVDKVTSKKTDEKEETETEYDY